MLPNFIEEERKSYRMTPDSFHKAHKIIHYSITLMKYIAINSYFKLINIDSPKLKKIQNLLCENFLRPTEGKWLNFFEQIILADPEVKSVITKGLSEESDTLLNELSFTFISKEFRKTKNSIQDFFYRIIKIKNTSISHGLLSEDNADFFVEKIEPILNEVIQKTESFLSLNLFLINSTASDSYEIIPYENIDFKENDYNLDNVDNDGLYICIDKKLYYAWPFITCRDGTILIYDSFDNKTHKVNFVRGSNRPYIYTDSNTLPELFGIDYNYLNSKPLDIHVKCTNGVSHNLPNADYDKFIGREKERNELKTALEHKRHFITALDGIGGVGKTAIALHCCEELLVANQQEPFEYIIWLSAKNTRLQNGKIIQLEQSFEHLGQLLDTILIVLGFNEYIQKNELKEKTNIVYELLEQTKALLVLDNLETIKTDNLEPIWDFINNIPEPSKVLLTSREFPQSVPQTIRIENLSEKDSYSLIDQFASEINISQTYLQGIRTEVYNLSSGLPIVIKSILGQIKLDKNINIIKKEIQNNSNNISKFCFEQQLRILDKDQKIVILAICLSTEILNHDALQLVTSDLISNNLNEIVQNLRNFSIIKITNTEERTEYTILPIIKNYALGYFKESELVNEVQKKLNEYYELKDVENYALLPIEAEYISCDSLIPRKMIDKAMSYANSGEAEQAILLFKKATTEYSLEPYTWYMYSQYLAQTEGAYKDAINCLKKAATLTSNYLYYKKMGDYYLKLGEQLESIRSYKEAHKIANEEKNKSEMIYLLANAEFKYIKALRKRIKNASVNYESDVKDNLIAERNSMYNDIINNLNKYISTQPKIYDAKKEKIYRTMAEAYFGLKQYDDAINYINMTCEISNNDPYHTEFRRVIFETMTRRGIHD
ncbi:MAG: hypothetical protein J6J00_00455 [Treponema sp.]|nr:hypothetical protein [Treponema sp.]